MPHVVVKLTEGRSGAQKVAIAEAVTRAVMATADCPESAVSVLIEDVAEGRWREEVYTPEIAPNLDRLAKRPGYGPG